MSPENQDRSSGGGNALLSAAIGLTSLGSGNSSPSPSTVQKDATDKSPNQDQGTSQGMSQGTSVPTNNDAGTKAGYGIQRPGSEPMMAMAATMMDNGGMSGTLPGAPSGPFRRQTSEPMLSMAGYLANNLPYDQDFKQAGNNGQSDTLRWPSAVRGQTMQDDLRSLRMQQAFGSSTSAPMSDAAMRMALASDRAGMMDRAAFMSGMSSGMSGMGMSGSGFGGFNSSFNSSFGSSAFGSLPPLPTPHQITPVPNTKNFPETLHEFISSEEHADIIGWLPHGRGFIIHDKQRFVGYILQRYFDGAKFTSFTRRLKRWGFVRVPRGPELGAYYNKFFVRETPSLVKKMKYRTDGQFDKIDGDGKDGKKEVDPMEQRIEDEVKRRVQESLQSQGGGKGAQVPTKTEDGDKAKALSRNDSSGSGVVSESSSHSSGMMADLMTADKMSVPNMVTPNDPQDRRLTDMQRSLLLSRCMMSQDKMTSPGGARNSTNQGGNFRESLDRTAASLANRRMELVQAERIMAAKRKLEADCRRDAMASKMMARDGDMMATAARNANARMGGGSLVPPFAKESQDQGVMGPMSPMGMSKQQYMRQGMGQGMDGKSGRPVIMSEHEEEEFARYLMMRQNTGRGGSMLR